MAPLRTFNNSAHIKLRVRALLEASVSRGEDNRAAVARVRKLLSLFGVKYALHLKAEQLPAFWIVSQMSLEGML